jgi:hypothetical protein
MWTDEEIEHVRKLPQVRQWQKNPLSEVEGKGKHRQSACEHTRKSEPQKRSNNYNPTGRVREANRPLSHMILLDP